MDPNQSSTLTISSSSGLPLQDRVAIVTGSSRGIGKGIALHLASLGARVVINYTSPSSQSLAQELILQINSLPLSTSTPRAIAVQADVSDDTQVQSLFSATEQAFGSQLHILVTSAGIANENHVPLQDFDLSDFDKIMGVNARGTFLCIKEAAKRIKRSGGGGRIVTVSTSLAAAFWPGYGAYTASKAAVEAMTKILAKELKGTGITANCVAPGPVATEMFLQGKSDELIKSIVDGNPSGRLGKVDDIASFVGFLVSDAGEWINGQIIRINGGYV